MRRGFTLIELMVVITIISIIIVIAVPTYSDYNNNQKLIETANQLQIILREAQNNAQTGRICNDKSKALYWYIPLSNNITEYSMGPYCEGNQQTQQSIYLTSGIKISNVAITQAGVNPCSPSETSSLDVRFSNITSNVSFVSPECPDSANTRLEVTLTLMDGTRARKVVVEKGGGIYVAQ